MRLVLEAGVPLHASAATKAGAAGAPLAMSIAEARGDGQPLWRRWVDLDGDGRRDLVVVAGRSTTPPPTEGSQVEALLAYMRVTPDFLDDRQVLVYRQTPAGVVPWGEPLPLTGDTAAVDVGDIDGDGRPEILFAAGFRIFAFSRPDAQAPYSTQRQPVADAVMLIGHTRAFVPGARLLASLEKGGPPILLFATPAGLEARRRQEGGGFGERPDVTIHNPFRRVVFFKDWVGLSEPTARVLDADGDGTLDLLFVGDGKIAIVRGLGGGALAGEPLVSKLPEDEGSSASPEVIDPDSEEDDGVLRENESQLVDINGDGLLDFSRNVGEDERQNGDEGKSRKRKGEPLSEVRIRLGKPGLVFSEKPDIVVTLPRREKLEGALARPLRIDADGRSDLVVVRFSVGFFQIARALMTKKISIGVAFESMLQRADGTFAPSRGKPFETKLLIDLKRGISASPTSVRGDFNGDGVTDLVEFTDKPATRIHLTTAEGEFPEAPALTVPMKHMPEDSALLDIEDLDGDGRSDIAFFTPEGAGFVVTLLRSRS